MTESLIVEKHAGYVKLTLNRPKTRNALDTVLVHALGDALEQLTAESDLRSIVLTGAGGAFCAGADLKAAMSDPDLDSKFEGHLDAYHRVTRAVVAAPMPVIAAVDGPAVGFGCDLALACDLRIATSGAYFQESFINIGLMPDGGGTRFYTQYLGTARALEWILSAKKMPAKTALSFGMVNAVVPAEGLEAATMAWVNKLMALPPLSVRGIKRAVRAAPSASLDQTLALEKEGQLSCLRSADFKEGVMAFLQKRTPTFSGK